MLDGTTSGGHATADCSFRNTAGASAYVFQEGRLFPHLTVRQNLLFGRWFTPPRERHVTLDQVLDLLDIGQLLGSPAARPVGRREAARRDRSRLARLAALLLMDEPLASLDGSRKDEILPFIERLRDEPGSRSSTCRTPSKRLRALQRVSSCSNAAA